MLWHVQWGWWGPPRGEVGGCRSRTAGMWETALGGVLSLILSCETTDRVSQGGIGGIWGVQYHHQVLQPSASLVLASRCLLPPEFGVLPGRDCAGPDARGIPFFCGDMCGVMW